MDMKKECSKEYLKNEINILRGKLGLISKTKVRERDGFKCRLCGDTSNDTILESHHLTPRSLGGDDSPWNLITVCKPCHLFLHCNPKMVMKMYPNGVTKSIENTIKLSGEGIANNVLSKRTKEGIENARKNGKKIGRPLGSKDKKPRKNDGYIARYKTPIYKYGTNILEFNRKNMNENEEGYLKNEETIKKQQ